MPQRINVPGIGPVDFPDGMNDDQITAAIKSNAPQGRGVVDQLTGGTGERYQTWPERLVRGLGSSIAELPSLPQRAMQSAGDLQRTGDQYDPAPIVEAAGLVTPLSPGIAAGERAIPGVAKSFQPGKTAVPTATELKAEGGAGFDTAREMGVAYHAKAVNDMAAKLRTQLEKDGIFKEDAPGTFAKLERLQTAPEGSFATFENLHSARKSLGRVAGDFARTKEDRLAATTAIKELDSFLEKPAAENVLAGPAAPLGPVFKDAKGNIAAAERSNDITGELDRAYTGILDKAELRAGSTASGRNLDNTIRQRVERILSSPKEIRGFSDPEVAGMEAIVEGGRLKNTARVLGNWGGGGGGLGNVAASGLGAGLGSLGGPVGTVLGAVIPPVAGIAARKTANTMSRDELLALDEAIRKRSPLFLQREAQTPQIGTPTGGRAAVLRALMLENQ